MISSLGVMLGPITGVDMLDLAVVAVLIYGGLRILNAERHRGVLVLATGLAGIYFAARSFGLLLTERVAGIAMPVGAIALALVFQDDLRRSVRRLGSWQLGFRRTKSVERRCMEALVDFAFDSAAQRVGALVVVKRHDRLDEHISRPVSMLCPVAPALLHAIFDPLSPWHDGAVIVDGDHLTAVAAHLPLGSGGEQLAGGTRHRAAVGLTELCDALVIVSSEERGTVSVARDGQLRLVESPEVLQQILGLTHDPAPSLLAMAIEWPLRHGRLKLLALALAVIVWVSFSFDADLVTRSYIVPIEYHNVPRSLKLDDAAPDEARVILSGPAPAFELLDTRSLGVFVDLSQVAAAGDVDVPLNESACRHPADLKLERATPGTIHLRLEARS